MKWTQVQIKPQTPKIPKPKKRISDIEGLGKRIPIENIEAIAGNIGAAALTGGASAAGEALLTGGATGLMGALPLPLEQVKRFCKYWIKSSSRSKYSIWKFNSRTYYKWCGRWYSSKSSRKSSSK